MRLQRGATALQVKTSTSQRVLSCALVPPDRSAESGLCKVGRSGAMPVRPFRTRPGQTKHLSWRAVHLSNLMAPHPAHSRKPGRSREKLNLQTVAMNEGLAGGRSLRARPWRLGSAALVAMERGEPEPCLAEHACPAWLVDALEAFFSPIQTDRGESP